jgi:hypothetical protein
MNPNPFLTTWSSTHFDLTHVDAERHHRADHRRVQRAAQSSHQSRRLTTVIWIRTAGLCAATHAMQQPPLLSSSVAPIRPGVTRRRRTSFGPSLASNEPPNHRSSRAACWAPAGSPRSGSGRAIVVLRRLLVYGWPPFSTRCLYSDTWVLRMCSTHK